MVHCSVLCCFRRRKRNCYNSMSVRLRHIPTWSCGRTFSKHIVLKPSYTFGVSCFICTDKILRLLKLQSYKNLGNWLCSSWLYLKFPLGIPVLQLIFVQFNQNTHKKSFDIHFFFFKKKINFRLDKIGLKLSCWIGYFRSVEEW